MPGIFGGGSRFTGYSNGFLLDHFTCTGYGNGLPNVYVYLTMDFDDMND
jgi:hypothetical protein